MGSHTARGPEAFPPHGAQRTQENACYRDAVDSGRDVSSFFMTTPPFMTNLTFCISVTSVSGLPATAITSANLPFSTLPTCPGERNKLVFGLARALKAIPGLIDAGLEQLQPLVRQWHNLAKPNIGTPAFEETWLDFIHAWPRVKFPGKEPMAMILATAVALEPPEAVRHYESEPLKLLASLCRELQRATGDAPFFLSVRTVGKYFNVDPGTASRWLTLLRFDRVIDEVEKGTQKTGRASRYRFLGNLQRLSAEGSMESASP